MIKQLAAATLLVLPLAISALPANASAMEVFIGPNHHRYWDAPHRRWVGGHWDRGFHRRWVGGHWEGYGRYHHWVGGHYVRW